MTGAIIPDNEREAATGEVALARAVGLRGGHAYLSANGWIRADSPRRETVDIYVWPEDEREAAIVRGVAGGR